MSETRQQGNSAVAVIAIALLMLLAGMSYWIWTKHGQTLRSSEAQATNSSPAANCTKLSLQKGAADGTAGTVYWHVVITNNGDNECQLIGYPAAFMKDAANISIGAASNALYSPTTVLLAAHGGKAHAIIGLPNAANFDSAIACTSTESSVLKLYPPGMSSSLEMPFKSSACPGFSITALQPGA